MKEQQLTMKEFSGERCNLCDAQKDALKKILDFASMTLEIGNVPIDSTGYSSLLESYVIDYCKASGYAAELEKDAEERHQKIRGLNIENRELRRQLGEKITGDDARERVKIMAETLAKWWKSEIGGFASSTDMYCAQYGFHASLSFSEVLHVSEEELNRMRCGLTEKYGIEFVCVDGDEWFPSMSEGNVRNIMRMIQDRFPSAELYDVRDVKYRPFPLRIYEMDIVIRDCDDFEKEEKSEASK